MSNREDHLNRRFEKKSARVGIQTQHHPATAPGKSEEPQKRSGKAWIALLIVAVAVATAIVIWQYSIHSKADIAIPTPPESAERFVQVASQYANAIALVVVTHPEMTREAGPLPIGTAWAVGPNVFATNAHVAIPVQEVLDAGGAAYLAINRAPDRRYRITRSVCHPRYEQAGYDFDGREEAVSSYDVALFFIEETVEPYFELADDEELARLSSGYRVSYLGFPMEEMAGGGVNPRSPVATMQSGIITSVTNYWLSDASFADQLLVHHNLAATGGASGSPIFNQDGKIVAILNAGNIGLSLTHTEMGLSYKRMPSAVLVNFAQRADLVRELLKESSPQP